MGRYPKDFCWGNTLAVLGIFSGLGQSLYVKDEGMSMMRGPQVVKCSLPEDRDDRNDCEVKA